MKLHTLSLVLAAALGSVAAGGCKNEPGGAVVAEGAVAATPGTIEVDQLASLVRTGACTVVDANNQSTRLDMGIIPGARLLTSYEEYDLAELPAAKDQKLVFYCANQACGASHKAAERALIAGYRDVNVFPGGIAGWKKAGNAVTTVQ